MKLNNLNNSKNSTKVKIEPTSYCNAKCDFCIHNTLNSYNHADLKELIKFLDILDKNYKIYISGNTGDPLCYPYLKELLDYVSNTFKLYKVITNGSFNLNSIKFLENYKDLIITFSIDSTLEYDRYRKINAQKSINNMIYLKDKGLEIYCKSLIFKYNIDEIKKLEKICKDHDIDYSYYESRKYNNSGDLSEPKEYKIKTNEFCNFTKCPLEDFLDININVDGYIIPCCMINPRTIYDKNIKDINNIDELNEYFRYYYKKIHPNCIRCKYK